MNPPLHPASEAAPGYGYQAQPHSTEALGSVRVVLEKLWLIVLVGISGFFITYGYLAHQQPVYLATGSLQVEPPHQESSGSPVSSDEPNLSTTEELNTLAQELQRPSFLLGVANDPTLQADPFLFPPKSDGSTYTDQEKIEKVSSAVRVMLEKGTLLILVFATHPQPATAQRLCEAMLQNFVKERMESKNGFEEETYQFLLSEAERLGQALADKEREVQKYEQLGKYNDQIETYKARIGELSQRYKDKYPAMIEARSLLASLQQSFDAEMLRILRSEGDHPAIVIDPATGITDDERARMMGEYQVLKRDIETQRSLFESLSAQKNQSDVIRAAQAETAVKIGDHPVLPEQPVARNAIRLLSAGTLLGLAFGVALAFLLDSLDRSLRTVDQVETLLNLPVLTAVPELERPAMKKKSKSGRRAPILFNQLPILVDGNSPSAESIRSLRASMALMGVEERRRSVVFTSALPGEGKSFTAANYSIALANQGLRTLLIDADLRRPSLHTVFGVEREHIGAVDYFLEEAPLGEFITTTSLPCLNLLLCGTAAPNPAELLSGVSFSRLMEAALAEYDRIVIDTAPVNVVSDTLMLVREVHSVCLVVRASSSPREAVLRSVKMLEKAGRLPVGVVFNRVPRRAGLGYYYHNYYYHYGSSGRYGSGYAPAPT